MVHSFQSIKAEFLEFALEDSREPFKDQMAESLRAVVHSIGLPSERTTFMPKMMPPIVAPLSFQRTAP